MNTVGYALGQVIAWWVLVTFTLATVITFSWIAINKLKERRAARAEAERQRRANQIWNDMRWWTQVQHTAPTYAEREAARESLAYLREQLVSTISKP